MIRLLEVLRRERERERETARALEREREREAEVAVSTLRSLSPLAPRRVFLPSSSSLSPSHPSPSPSSFHVTARASAASRAAYQLNSTIAARKKSLDSTVALMDSPALADEIERVNDQFMRFNRLYARSPEARETCP